MEIGHGMEMGIGLKDEYNFRSFFDELFDFNFVPAVGFDAELEPEGPLTGLDDFVGLTMACLY